MAAIPKFVGLKVCFGAPPPAPGTRMANLLPMVRKAASAAIAGEPVRRSSVSDSAEISALLGSKRGRRQRRVAASWAPKATATIVPAIAGADLEIECEEAPDEERREGGDLEQAGVAEARGHVSLDTAGAERATTRKTRLTSVEIREAGQTLQGNEEIAMPRARRLPSQLVVQAFACLAAGTFALADPSPPAQPVWPGSYLRTSGEVTVPVLLVRFQASAAPFAPEILREHLFTDTGGSRSLTDYLREVSYGKFLLQGDLQGWFELSHESAYYYVDAECNSICTRAYGPIAEMIRQAVGKARDAGVDFSRYDDDGPDGRPDSGDDDGFVDLLVVAHSEAGSGCEAGDGSWLPGINAHEQKYWNLADPHDYLDTGSPRQGGGSIRVNEVVVVPGRGCRVGQLPPVGTYAHEIGHALGLPDLVDQDKSSGGIGIWSLMAEGGAGGDGHSPDTPVHLSAWAKERLGWLQPRPLARDDRDSLEAVELRPDAIRIPLGGATDPYYLLEVRSRAGFDRNLPGSGLLVWRVDPVVVDAWDQARRANADERSVNDEDDRKGVVLIEADGRADLAGQTLLTHCGCLGPPGCTDTCAACCANSGDAGDPFPGDTAALHFDAASWPPNSAGTALCCIAQVGDDVYFRIEEDGTCD